MALSTSSGGILPSFIFTHVTSRPRFDNIRVHHLRANKVQHVADDVSAFLGQTKSSGNERLTDLGTRHECNLVCISVDELGKTLPHTVFARAESIRIPGFGKKSLFYQGSRAGAARMCRGRIHISVLDVGKRRLVGQPGLARDLPVASSEHGHRDHHEPESWLDRSFQSGAASNPPPTSILYV
jgi:hypothetical protein